MIQKVKSMEIFSKKHASVTNTAMAKVVSTLLKLTTKLDDFFYFAFVWVDKQQTRKEICTFLQSSRNHAWQSKLLSIR